MSSHREVYSFTWPGKHEALLEAGKPTDKTLRPCVEESLNFYDTQNLYIEGDNLEVMKILQRAYMKKIKMIYIDPPYNTGHDFIYRDDFTYTIEKEREQYEFTDDIDTRNFTAGNYFENTRNRPRFHSDWCSMMYPRLKIAHNVLADDGVIFISIDDNEITNLRKICDEIFGENNFVAILTIKGNPRGRQSSEYFAQVHDFILVYRSSSEFKLKGFDVDEETKRKRFSKQDEYGEFEEWELRKRGAAARKIDVPTLYFPIFYNPVTNDISVEEIKGYSIKILPFLSDGTEGRWRWSRQKIINEKSKLYVRKNSKGIYNIYERKIFAEKTQQKAPTIWDYSDVNTELGTKLLRELFDGNKYFDYPKPVALIQRLLMLIDDKNFTVLDFFSGSATTAHAVINLNAQDGGHRKFIMIQLPEECAPRSEAAKAGYANICEIGKERIRRAGRNLSGDTGFRVFKLDSSNYNDVYLTAEEFLERDIDDMIENIKPDRTGMDLLFDYAADIGLSLSLEYEVSKFKGFEIHQYGYDEIIACFDKNLDEDTIKYIAKLKPKRAIFFESCFENLMSRLNLGQIFRFYAPKAEMIIL